jgi:hypothetical protein
VKAQILGEILAKEGLAYETPKENDRMISNEIPDFIET